MKTDGSADSIVTAGGAKGPIKLSRVRSSFHRNRRMIAEGGWVVAGSGAYALAVLVGVRLLTEATPPSVYGAVGLLVGILTVGRSLFTSPVCAAARESPLSGTELDTNRY